MAPATPQPSQMPPPTTMVPSKNSRTALTKAKGLIEPVCPPAPLHTQARPSAPASAALRASVRLTTSAKTCPP